MIEELKGKTKIEKEKVLAALSREATEFRKETKDVEYVKNRAYYEGFMWKLTQLSKDSPFMIQSDMNHLKNAVDLRLGSLIANDYLGELLPKSPDDVEAIETLNVLYKNEWSVLDLDNKIPEVIKDGAIGGDGYLEFSFDADEITGSTGTRYEGQIKVKPLHLAGMYIDPNADSFNDASFIISKQRKSISWLKREKPEWYKKVKEVKKNLENGISDRDDAGQIYVGHDYEKEQSKSIIVETFYIKNEKEVEVDLEENNTKDKVKAVYIGIYYMVNGVLVEENFDYPFDEFPIVKFTWEKAPQFPYGIPLLRGLTTPQMVVNLIESSINTIAMHNAVPSWIISDDSGLDIDEVSKLIPAMGVIYKASGDPTRAIVPLQMADVNAELVAIKDSFINSIQSHAGVSGAYIGNIGTAGSTAGGTADAINRATIIDNNPIRNIQSFVESVTKLLVKFMTYYYADRKVYVRKEVEQGVDKPKYTFKEYVLESGFENVEYDFAIDLLIKTMNDKGRQYNVIREIYQLQNQYRDPYKVVKVTDLAKAANLDNYNELANRWMNMSEEALAEKASLIIEMMQMANTQTPQGEFVIPAEEIQQGILDVLNDDGELQVVDGIFNKFQQFQDQIRQQEQAAMMQEQQMAMDKEQAINDIAGMLNQ